MTVKRESCFYFQHFSSIIFIKRGLNILLKLPRMLFKCAKRCLDLLLMPMFRTL